MALWPAGFDPFYGLDPLSGFGAQLGGGFGGPQLPGFGGGGFYDPYWAPGATGATRRRLSAPSGGGAGAGTAGTAGAGAGITGGGGTEAQGEQGGGGEGRRRTREPYTVGSAGWTRSIPCDFIERGKEYIVRADIPGCKKEEIHVEVHDGNVLRFGHNPNAEREKEDIEEEGIFHRAERVTTFRNRNLRMPDDADMSGELQAKYEDGVLSVVIPKKEGGRSEGRIVSVA